MKINIKHDYKCDICQFHMNFDTYYNKTDNLKFKPNIIMTICDSCSNKIKQFIREIKVVK